MIPAGLAADIQTNVINPSLIESGTNARTSATVACRVDSDRQQIHLDGMSSFAQVPRWRLIFASGTDVRPGDAIAVTGKGTFLLYEVPSPNSYNVAYNAYAVLTARSDGSWPVLTNYTVTLRRKNDQGAVSGSVSVDVLIEPVDEDEAILAPDGKRFTWRMAYPLSTVISTYPIEAGDEIVWPQLRKGYASLHRPAVHNDTVPYGLCYFREIE